MKLKSEKYKGFTIGFTRERDGNVSSFIIEKPTVSTIGITKLDAFDNIKNRIDEMSLKSNSKDINKKIAEDIIKFVKKNELGGDMRIYYNGKAYDIDDKGNSKFVGYMKASDMFDYANDKSVSMSFEGPFYSMMNDYMSNRAIKLQENFSKILNKYGVYYELGNAWNLSLYNN